MASRDSFRQVLSITLVIAIGLLLVATEAYGDDKNKDVIERGGIGVALLNLSNLNSSLESEGYQGFQSAVLLTSGGGHLNLTDNLRIGVQGTMGQLILPSPTVTAT